MGVLYARSAGAWVPISSPQPTRVGGTWRRVANQSIASGSLAYIIWDTEDADSNGFLTPPSNTLTIPSGQGGVYAISAAMVGGGGAASTIRIQTSLAGVVWDVPTSAWSGWGTVSAMVPFTAGATVNIGLFQNSGAATNATGRLDVYRVSP